MAGNRDIDSIQTLDAIVNKALFTIPDNQRRISDYKRFLEFAVDAIRELNLLVTKDGGRTIKVISDKNNRIPFPSDLEQFVSIGIPRRGIIVLLDRNDKIVPTTSILNGDEILDSSEGEGVDVPLEVSQLETLGLKGYYTVNYRDRAIIVHDPVRSELLLNYVSSGVDISSTTFIPSIYVKAIIFYIYWMNIVADLTVPENIKNSYWARYKQSCTEIRIIKSPSLADFMNRWNSKKYYQ
jgi:hypothetical protein